MTSDCPSSTTLVPCCNGEQAPYFYLPKLQGHLEARLWNDVFNFAQDKLDIPRGTICCTVLIEHILAAFEMEEILYELREHPTGLNLGRWDYIFSFIKTFSERSEHDLPRPGSGKYGDPLPHLGGGGAGLTFATRGGPMPWEACPLTFPAGMTRRPTEKAMAQVKAGQGT